ncbi:MAG: hypothetical protein NZ900_09360 [Synergistetes bacterium]|nr:hypothetical protein [Synergistota bacterium]MDW8193124.1 hypothetical protein [Synergistota bacterium]
MGEKGVVKKIKFAKRWLEKAEEAYLQGKSEEGFLSLSLAEAEIRALHKGEWERALKLKKSPLRVVFEVSFLTILLVLALVSYPYMEVSQRVEQELNISPSFGHRLALGIPGRLNFSINLPRITFTAYCEGRIGLYNIKSFDAHILYVVRKEKVKVKEEAKLTKVEENHALSAEELFRLIELGRKEFKIYLTGGR